MHSNNLIPFDQMTPERHRELSAKGGIASGETRRKKAAARKWARACLDTATRRESAKTNHEQSVREPRENLL